MKQLLENSCRPTNSTETEHRHHCNTLGWITEQNRKLNEHRVNWKDNEQGNGLIDRKNIQTP